MKKLLAIILSAIMIFSIISTAVSATAWNPNGGCEIKTEIKKADPANVIKDGKIGKNEYSEIAINRDPEKTDCLLSWDTGRDELLMSSEEFLKNVHFYISWDETHGLNFAIQATLLETPENKSPQPDNNYYEEGGEFPGDEFLFQFGSMFTTFTPNGKIDKKTGMPQFDTTLYRGISKNTETGELLIGHYGKHGLTGAIDLKAETDYNVFIDGKTITYEISYPLASIIPAEKINGASPVDGTELWFTMSTTGGSQGVFHKDNDTFCYCVSIGDTGYMADKKAGDKLCPAMGTFSNEEVKNENDTPDIPDTPDKPDIPDTPDKPDKPDSPKNPFTDLVEGSFYYDPVLWAVGKKITDGTTPTTFEPEKTCTRGQIVTFLWRALGSPEPKSTTNPFGDVKSGSYYYKPVLWAVENKVTNGVEADKFGPDANVTRGQTVTFLWRAAGEEKATATNPFKDVASGEFYTDAVLWAVNKNITNGTSANEFSPQNECTRAQIVTFLNRFDSNK